ARRRARGAQLSEGRRVGQTRLLSPAMSEESFPDLRAFLEALRRGGQLVQVEAPVDARLEVAEIHRRVIAAGGPALLFTRVRGSDLRLATNLFGTRARAEMAF